MVPDPQIDQNGPSEHCNEVFGDFENFRIFHPLTPCDFFEIVQKTVQKRAKKQSKKGRFLAKNDPYWVQLYVGLSRGRKVLQNVQDAH